MYDIEWTRRALKQLKKIDHARQKQIVIAVRDLKQWPDCQNVKRLQNSPGYRLRVGRYRVFFDVADRLKIVTIEEVKKRDDRTY
jgi:mRNA interferase RelE/StbE